MTGPITIAAKHLIAAGITGEALLAAIADIEAAMAPAIEALDCRPMRTARQEANARYYQKCKAESDLKKSEKVLISAEQDQKEIPPTPPKEKYISNPPILRADDCDEAVKAFNALASELSLPRVQNFSEQRRRAMRKRLAECGGLDGWHVALSKIRGSPFLCGENQRGWRADLDFLLQAKSFTRLMEGGYDGTGRSNSIADAFDAIRAGLDEARGGSGHNRSHDLENEPCPF